MREKYDLLVVGAGPAGLLALKTAAEVGLKVALIERKENIVEIRRACSIMVISLSGRYLKWEMSRWRRSSAGASG